MKEKRLLLIAPLFFGYYREIIKEAKLLGYETDYICDAPSDSNISKAIGRINKKLISRSTQKYFNKKVWPLIKNQKYNAVLLVGGMTFALLPEMIEQIKNANPNAKYVMYQWDSEKNLPYSTQVHKYFDRLYSFDRYDCLKNSQYRFLPLFYTRIYEKIGRQKVEKYKYGCSYIGTAHPQKYKKINEISKALETVFSNQFIYHYMPSKLKYIYHKLFAPEYKDATLSDFKMNKIEENKIMQIFSSSKCILDAPQAGQTGLTIRTIECLGAKRKLITTNKDIVNYDFYSESNILVYTGEINKKSPFFINKYVEVEENIYKKYSLRNWLKTLLEEGNK